MNEPENSESASIKKMHKPASIKKMHKPASTNIKAEAAAQDKAT